MRWLTCLTVIRFKSIQWESPTVSPTLARRCFQFNSIQWRCAALRFDFVLIKSVRLATSFSSVLYRRRLSNLLICLSALVAAVAAVVVAAAAAATTDCHTVGKEINAYLKHYISRGASSRVVSIQSDIWYIYIHFSSSRSLSRSPDWLVSSSRG